MINMFAQYNLGTPLRQNRRCEPPPELGVQDSTEQRELWFEHCLDEISQHNPTLRSIAFPENIGCGLAGGRWSRYKAMTECFAQANQHMEVLICERTGEGAPDSTAERASPRAPGHEEDLAKGRKAAEASAAATLRRTASGLPEPRTSTKPRVMPAFNPYGSEGPTIL